MKDNKLIKSLEKYKYLTAIPNFKDKKAKDITSLVLTFLALIFFSLFAINPTLSTIARLQKELSDNKYVEQQLQTKISNISNLQNQYARISTDLPIIKTAVPTDPQAPILVAQIQAIGSTTGINISTVQVFPVEINNKSQNRLKTGSYSFNITADGSYDNLNSFLTKLSTMRRVISIDQITLSKKNLEVNILQMTLKGTSYFEP